MSEPNILKGFDINGVTYKIDASAINGFDDTHLGDNYYQKFSISPDGILNLTESSKTGQSLNSQVKYAIGTSSVQHPTENWTSAIPVVPDGYFLWIEVTLSIGTNNSLTYYIPIKQGKDAEIALYDEMIKNNHIANGAVDLNKLSEDAQPGESIFFTILPEAWAKGAEDEEGAYWYEAKVAFPLLERDAFIFGADSTSQAWISQHLHYEARAAADGITLQAEEPFESELNIFIIAKNRGWESDGT